MSKQFTEEQTQWLKDNYFKFEYVRILKDVYNFTFNESRTTDTIKHKCRKMGLTRGRLYTKEMDKWLIENIGSYSRKELLEMFNKKFQQKRTEDCLKVHCNRELNIYFKDSEERYRNTRSISQQLPLGTEVKRGGYIWVKVSDKSCVSSERAGYVNWKPKHHIVWEKCYGELPQDKQIIFLNQNKEDCAIENLYAVSRSVNAIMVKNKWYTTSREHTLTAIRWCELHFIRKESED